MICAVLWMLQAENADLHTPAVSQHFMILKAMAIIARPPYSPDLVSSDFGLYRRVQGVLK
jgi:hypothetical protein